MTSLKVDIAASPYQAMLGVGGIGSGTFFALNGNQTLGREESRSGVFLDRRDYCKLHIISHYTKVLLGENFAVMPIGLVGDDAIGHQLMEEMGAAGLELRHVRILPGEQTLTSFCFIYPDGSGGNLTTENSACGKLDEEIVRQAEADFAMYAGCGIALAVPEVPLRARQELLQMGTKYGFLRVASFTSSELPEVVSKGSLANVDLLSLNRDEAAALVGATLPQDEVALELLVEVASERLQDLNLRLQFFITAGAQGSWSWDGKVLSHLEAFPTEVVGSAGAGDAFLAGVIAGLTGGLSLVQAQELGALTAAAAVTSPHTIAPELDALSLRRFAEGKGLTLSEQLINILPTVE